MSDTKKIVIDETTWQKLMEEPVIHFLQAKESLLNDNKREVARNIRKEVIKNYTFYFA